MQTTKFKAAMITRYMDEILGNNSEDYPFPKEEALVFKSIPQKTKFHLRKLFDNFLKEIEAIRKEADVLQEEHRKNIEGKEGEDLQKIEEEFGKKIKEFDGWEVEINHYPFEEKDFLDSKTGSIVGGKEYYNLIDVLIFEE